MFVRKSSGVGFRLGFSIAGIGFVSILDPVKKVPTDGHKIVRPADPETAGPGRPTAPHARKFTVSFLPAHLLKRAHRGPGSALTRSPRDRRQYRAEDYPSLWPL